MSELACLPYAVGHGHEGICLNLQLGPHRVLLDCGTAWVAGQSPELPPADWVICTHAHPDHGMGLPGFHRAWPQVPILASTATADLLPLNWPEVVSAAATDFCQRLPWRQVIPLAPDLTLKLWPAGHLPGAACALLTYAHRDRNYTVFYTGDFFLSNARLVEGLPLDELRGLKPDVLIVEGSHGTARHPHRRQQENRLADQINQAIAAGFNVLLPVPILGLGQELVMLLRSHHHFTGRDLTVWVDPSVAEGCDAYLELLPHLPTNVQNFARHQPLFWDERILPRVRRIPSGGALADPATPAIVIGYQEADLSRYGAWGDRPWRILMPESLAAQVMAAGFDASPDQSPNRTLDWLQALDAHLEAGRAHLETYLLTTHCDGPGTTQLIHNLRPQHVVFVHGSPNYLMDLASLEDLQSRYHLHLPSPGKWVDLPIGDRFLQPAAPETVFEGEIAPAATGLQLTLPEALQRDPRWYRLLDTGVVQVRWQGDDLLLRGLSSQALLHQNAPAPAVAGVACCLRCQFWQQQRCTNPKSSLFGFQVAAEGYCPEFRDRASQDYSQSESAS